MERWTTSIKATVNKKDPLEIINAFKKGYELEETYWTYQSLYLSSEKQERGETVAALTTRVEDLVNLCKWPAEQKEQRRIDLYYHLSEVFDVRRFIQIKTSREGGNLTWEKLVEEAKCQEHVGKEYTKFRRENGGGGTPSYGDPALAADAISRGYNRPQPRSQTPSGGKGGKSQKQCDQCGRRNGCTGKKGTCPAWGKECGIFRGKNHYKAVCQKAAQMQAGGGAQPKFQKQGKGKSPGKNGKAKPKHAHFVVFKTVPSAKGIVSGLEERASTSNSVTSEPSVSLTLGVQRVNSVLSAGNRQSKASLHTRNVFSCDSIHNTGDNTLDQCQTDTDPSGRLYILADIHVRARTTSRTHYIRVKVDPGADANLMPLHHFREIFPYLCDKNGKPKEGVLEKAESSFESYSGDNVPVIGQTKIYAKNKQTQQFMITRIFMIARERGPTLLGNAACQWLGLIAMLIENKAPVVGRYVAAVTREETECGEVEAYPLPKTGDGAEMTKPTSKPRLTIEAPKKKRKRTKKANSVANASEPLDITLESTPSESQPSAPERTEPDGSQEQNTVLSGSTPQAELGPKMKGIRKKRVKDGPIRKADSTEIPQRKYYRPAADAKTYRINGQGQLQCQQDPKDVTRVGSVKELPLCRDKPIFHEPVGALITDKEQLTAMYPNSFDRIGSLKGEYTIKIDPSIAPVQQARCKVPIESKEAISVALDSMIAGDILEPQIEPTPWVNNATYPVKPTGEVRPCLDCIPLNKAIIRENHTLPTVEEIAHELAGARYFTKGDAYKAFLHVHLSKKSRELTVFRTNTQASIQENAFWHENEPRRVSDTDGPYLRTVPRRDWHSRRCHYLWIHAGRP